MKGGRGRSASGDGGNDAHGTRWRVPDTSLPDTPDELRRQVDNGGCAAAAWRRARRDAGMAAGSEPDDSRSLASSKHRVSELAYLGRAWWRSGESERRMARSHWPSGRLIATPGTGDNGMPSKVAIETRRRVPDPRRALRPAWVRLHSNKGQ
ncbi:protein of unknown function [Pararobbsia alpina]